jgi:hypothetical protein
MVSFATVEEADEYHANHLFGANWREDIEVEDKEMALETASRLLVAHVPWLTGYLRYYTVAPLVLKEATAEFARRLIERGDPFAGSDTSGMKRMKAGPVDVEFTDSSGEVTAVPVEVLAMLSVLQEHRGSSLSVPLVRY